MSVAVRILTNECRQLLRSRVSAALAVVLVASGVYSIAAGVWQMRAQSATIDVLLQKETSRLDAQRASLGELTYALGIDGDAARAVYDRPATLAPLAVGQRDVLPFYRQVSGRSLVYDGAGVHFDGMADDIANPERLLTGNFDLAFVIVFLYPLALIALCYDVLSGEREDGTFALWAASGTAPTTIVAWRLVGRTLPMLALTAGLVMLGAFWSGAGVDATGDVVLMIAVAWGYLAWWVTVALLVIAADRSSAANALTLFSAYLAVSFIVPSAIGLAIDAIEPPVSHAESALLLRDRNDALWGEIDAAAWEQFHRAAPDVPRDATINLEPALEDSLGYGKKIVVWHHLMDATALPELDRYLAGLQRRDAMTRRLHPVAPAVLVSDLQSAIARTDVHAHLEFQHGMRVFQAHNARLLRQWMFPGTALTATDVPLYPPYAPPAARPLLSRPPFQVAATTLLVLTALSGSLGWWRLRRTFRPR